MITEDSNQMISLSSNPQKGCEISDPLETHDYFKKSTVHEEKNLLVPVSSDFQCQICLSKFPSVLEMAEHVEEKHYSDT